MNRNKRERNSFGIELKVSELNLDNFRGFRTLKNLLIGDKVTVIIAENGGGKTTILDAMAAALQVFLNQLLKMSFAPFPELRSKDVMNGTENGSIELKIEGYISVLHVLDDNQEDKLPEEPVFDQIPLTENQLQISINKEAISYKINEYEANEESDFLFKEYFKSQFRPEIDSMPVLAYYGGNSIDTQSEINKPLRENRLYHLYAGCLDAKRFSFNSFLRWFDTLYKVNMNKPENEKSRELRLIEEVVYRILNEEKEPDKWIFSNLRMHYELERDTLRVNKKNAYGQTVIIEVDQMSAGEKVMFAIAADIAKRLILANPDLLKDPDNTPLNGQGVVLIDEIDLHLHPKWQRLILPKLIELFPNVQFVVTTHSPFVVQSVEPNHCIRLNNSVPEYFDGEERGDYEEIAIDFFNIQNFFDTETTAILGEFREFVNEIVNKKRDVKNSDFISIIKDLSKRGEQVKSVVAFELAQMEKQLKENGKD
ncbi:MAG: AAA family ATPase [Saprospiraceae bacterium]